ncbi:MAG: hypothetical protein R3C44_09890 [Chloroflexota bacterium]
MTLDDPLMWILPVLFAVLVLGVVGIVWAIRRARARKKRRPIKL